MTTAPAHAAPWSVKRILTMFTQPTPRRRAAAPWIDHVLSGREASARHLYGEAVRWDDAAMVTYDASPILRGGWLAEADRRIAGDPEVSIPDLMVLRWWGYTPAEWDDLPALVQVDKREHFYQVRGL